ncbi:MAG: hypothetical protein HFG01_07340 [Oscillibacter sp.]|jgi:hypothetical protein|nr:hypothetical protein [Oscillibacter sp.]
MIDIRIQGGKIRVAGSFDLGYMGRYDADKIHLYDQPDRLRRWDVAVSRLGPDCTDGALSACLTEYFNAFEEKIHNNQKQVNDNFLIRAFEDMEACGYPYWEIDGLTRREYLPPDPDEDVYPPHWDEMKALELAHDRAPNDGSLEKPDVEAILRRNFPSLDWDALLASIQPEHLSLEDGKIAFQCSDGFGEGLLCGAYDKLDEKLTFTDWHNY